MATKGKRSSFCPPPSGMTLTGVLESLRPNAEKHGLTPYDALGLLIASWCKGSFIHVDDEQLKQLKGYSQITGKSVDDLVHEAIEDYISCNIEAHFEVLQERSASA